MIEPGEVSIELASTDTLAPLRRLAPSCATLPPRRKVSWPSSRRP